MVEASATVDYGGRREEEGSSRENWEGFVEKQR